MKIIKRVFYLLICMIVINKCCVYAKYINKNDWRENDLNLYESSSDLTEVSDLEDSLCKGPVPTSDKEFKEWQKRKEALKSNTTYIMKDTTSGATLNNKETDIQSQLNNKKDAGSSISSEDRYKNYSNWRSVPLSEFNVKTGDSSKDLEYADKLYKFLINDPIGIENMRQFVLVDYIDKIQALLDSEGFKRYEGNHPNARQNLLTIYGNISKNENAMKELEGTEEYNLISDSLPSSEAERNNVAIYKSRPEKSDEQHNAGDSLDDMISDADAFVNDGSVTYQQDKLSEVSNIIYNILLSVGVMIAVIIGAIIGIKLMVSSGVDKKVEAKQLLVPYVVGCVVVFGGFGIWKLLVQILQGL